MKVATPSQMNEIDRRTINEIGIPGVVLMENAAGRVSEEAVKMLGSAAGKKVIVIAGKGNNGGDAFAVARQLGVMGCNVKVYVTARKEDISGDAGINLGILRKIGLEPVELTENSRMEELKNVLPSADLIIDGILGTGLKGEVRDDVNAVINIVNAAQKPVISIDIPSGISGETGQVLGCCIKAVKTVTFALPKLGTLVHPGCEYTGELIVADIGIPSKVIEGMDIKINITDRASIAGMMPRRLENSNKGDYGRVFIITGSPGMTGSGCLAATAALRTGAGLVYLGVPSGLSSIYETQIMESVTIPLEDENTGSLSRKCLPRIEERMKQMDVLAVGPGLGTGDDIYDIVSGIIETADMPLVVDADALNSLSRDVSALKNLKTQMVITPHPGEMARLCGLSIREVQANRIGVAREFAENWKVITVLKGSRTVTALPDGTVYINPTGNPGMATAGSGDVLTGIISSLIGQGMAPWQAAVAGAYLHGLAGDNAASVRGEHGLIASDIAKELPYAIKEVLMPYKETAGK